MREARGADPKHAAVRISDGARNVWSIHCTIDSWDNAGNVLTGGKGFPEWWPEKKSWRQSRTTVVDPALTWTELPDSSGDEKNEWCGFEPTFAHRRGSYRVQAWTESSLQAHRPALHFSRAKVGWKMDDFWRYMLLRQMRKAQILKKHRVPKR